MILIVGLVILVLINMFGQRRFQTDLLTKKHIAASA